MSSNTGYRPIDSKREEFRKYLERAGVMDALTKVLVMLYEEADKPVDALEFLIKHLTADRPETAELESLRSSVEGLHLKIQKLEEHNAILKQRLEVYEPVDIDADNEDLQSDKPNGSTSGVDQVGQEERSIEGAAAAAS